MIQMFGGCPDDRPPLASIVAVLVAFSASVLLVE
jgi:hypothetical protein